MKAPQSFTIPYATLFPGINGTDTITDHGDTVQVGDVVDVYLHTSGLKATTAEFSAIKIVGISESHGCTTVYHEISGHPDALPGLFQIGKPNSSWWRTFVKLS